MLGPTVSQCLLCCGLYTFLFNMVHVHCLLHGRLWSAMLVCVKCGLCIGCGYTNVHIKFCGGWS